MTHPLRSLLTGLGVFIGVVSVVWLLAIGEGIAAQADDQIMELGANTLIVSSKKPPEEERSSKGAYFYSYGLTENDYLKISKTVPHISAAYPTRELDRRRVFTKDGSQRAELLGCLPNYRALYDLVLTKGRFISDEDNRDESEVCVLASSLARTLFPFGDSLGKPVNIGGNLYTVIGEVAPRTNLKDVSELGFKELFEDVPWLRMQEEKHGDSTWFSFGCVLQGALKGRRDEVIKAFEDGGIEARPLASGNFLNQPVVKMMPHYNHGNYEGAQDIDENGFWVGNHSTDCKAGIFKMFTILKGLAE